MHNLAIALHKSGHHISGSDDIIYDPAKSRLDALGLLPDKFGWDSDRIDKSLDLIILGMHAHPDNPELKKAQDLNIPIQSFPEFIGQHSANKIRVAVCGSHGKTTTTSMIMHILKEVDRKFDYAVGAGLEGFVDMVKLSDAPVIIIEGDEYLSSALDRRPKFVHYNAEISVITGIAWDHINVFPTYDSYESAFVQLIDSMPPDSTVIFNDSDEALSQLVSKTRRDIQYQPFHPLDYRLQDGLFLADVQGQPFAWPIYGEYNMQNMMAAWQVCKNLGVGDLEIAAAMKTFELPDKRMDLIKEDEELVIYRDYAHAPSKVKASVGSFVKRWQNLRGVAVLEIHTYSSLNKNFLPQYEGVFDDVEKAVIFYNPKNLEIKRLPEMSEDFIRQAFGKEDLQILTDADELDRWLSSEIERGGAFLLMSSSNFGNLNLDSYKELN